VTRIFFAIVEFVAPLLEKGGNYDMVVI